MAAEQTSTPAHWIAAYTFAPDASSSASHLLETESYPSGTDLRLLASVLHDAAEWLLFETASSQSHLTDPACLPGPAR